MSGRAKVERGSVRALHRHGVVHTDVWDANVPWDGERVMVMDFEQAKLVEPRPALARVVPNKRPWRGSETTAGKR